MEFNKSVANPMLVGTIQLMKEEDTPEHRNMFVAELQKSSLIAPAVIEPEPAVNAEGQQVIAPGSKIQFPMLAAPDGKRFFMGFTDMAEFQKWKDKNKELPFFALKFDDYVGMLFRKDASGTPCPALGYVVNPLGENILVPRELMAGIMAARMAQMKQQAGKEPSKKPGITVPGAAGTPKKQGGNSDKVL